MPKAKSSTSTFTTTSTTAVASPTAPRLSLDIPDDDMQAVQAALQTLQDKLLPHLVDLGVMERRQLAKMGPRTVDFVSRALGYARALPQYQPSYVDADAFQRNLDAIDTLRRLQHPLDLCHDMVDDSLLLAGSQAYEAALAMYDALKSAAKRGRPDAEQAANDLGQRFPRRATARSAAKPPIASQDGSGATATA
jgi:hypothetical protein